MEVKTKDWEREMARVTFIFFLNFSLVLPINLMKIFFVPVHKLCVVVESPSLDFINIDSFYHFHGDSFIEIRNFTLVLVFNDERVVFSVSKYCLRTVL